MNAQDLFDHLAAELAPRGATAATMFGKPALMAGGKAFACLKADALAVRLGTGTPAHTRALTLPGASLFDPSDKHRPFKDWVAVPATHSHQWPHLAETALAAVHHHM